MSIRDWSDLFVATAGAAAALAGLIIVAMSVNVKTILAIPGMTSRAASTIAGLTLIVVVSCAGLFPLQPTWVLGVEIAVASAVVLVVSVHSLVRIFRDRRDRSPVEVIGKGLLIAVPVALTLAGGLLLCASELGGLYVVGASMLLIVSAAVTNAWVLLIEILR
jgi:hypothetical protein